LKEEKSMRKWKFLTFVEILDWFGERCGEVELGCPTCRAWARYDFLKMMELEDSIRRQEFWLDEEEELLDDEEELLDDEDYEPSESEQEHLKKVLGITEEMELEHEKNRLNNLRGSHE
jgi:hypothetical protein